MSKGKHSVNRSALRAFAGSKDEPPSDKSPYVLLNEMAQVFGRHYGVSLPIPELLRSNGPGDVKKGKEFSVGLLENPGNHEWSGEGYRRLSKMDRMTIAGSLFLWRKTLPSTAPPQSAHKAMVTAPEIDLPPGYVAHLVRIVEENFPVGWDRGYIEAVERSVPTTRSCVESSRKKGGYRATLPDRFEYGLACMGEGRMTDSDREVKYMNAQCDGKVRAVTVMSGAAQRLKPLHKVLYNQISKSPWLLRGEAKPSVFRHFVRVPGEVFVSGDYENATNHLPVSSAEWILRAIFRRARHIPHNIQVDALKYLRVRIRYEDGIFEATRQLMGSLLCFPLLCIQNYGAFRWVFDRSVPVKINGDDIVFRSTREKYEEWAQFVGKTGLVLSPGKTMVSESLFSLNSTFFNVTKSSVRLIPVVRCTTLLPAKCPYPGSLSGSMRSFLRGFREGIRDDLGAWFLRRKGGLIRKSGRSVVRGLGMKATDKMIKAAGLWTRELWYLNSVPSRYVSIGFETEGVPLPQAPDRLTGQVEIPPGWSLQPLPADKGKARQALEKEQEFWEEVTDRAWTTGFDPTKQLREFWTAVSTGSFERCWYRWRQASTNKLVKKLMGVRTRSRLPSKPFYRVFGQVKERVKRVWARDEEETVAPEDDCPQGPLLMRPAYDTGSTYLRGELIIQRNLYRWLSEESALARFVQ
nr:MAG: RNA-dependent RNA polymerase [Sanya botourmia-like virus 7]